MSTFSAISIVIFCLCIAYVFGWLVYALVRKLMKKFKDKKCNKVKKGD